MQFLVDGGMSELRQPRIDGEKPSRMLLFANLWPAVNIRATEGANETKQKEAILSTLILLFLLLFG